MHAPNGTGDTHTYIKNDYVHLLIGTLELRVQSEQKPNPATPPRSTLKCDLVVLVDFCQGEAELP